jgi:hypothetical protein
MPEHYNPWWFLLVFSDTVLAFFNIVELWKDDVGQHNYDGTFKKCSTLSSVLLGCRLELGTSPSGFSSKVKAFVKNKGWIQDWRLCPWQVVVVSTCVSNASILQLSMSPLDKLASLCASATLVPVVYNPLHIEMLSLMLHGPHTIGPFSMECRTLASHNDQHATKGFVCIALLAQSWQTSTSMVQPLCFELLLQTQTWNPIDYQVPKPKLLRIESRQYSVMQYYSSDIYLEVS